MSKYVITGGPGFGKTSLVQALRAEGFWTGREVARDLIQEIQQRGGSELPWNDRAAFEKLLLARKIGEYLSAPLDQVCFFDRGLPDAVTYCRRDGVEPTPETIKSCLVHRYDGVFIVPPWPKIYKKDGERRETFEEAARTHEIQMSVYGEFGYLPLLVPKVSVPERVEFVKHHLA
jgi:predicted ATPase